MKRIILAVLLIICLGFCAFAQNTDPIDLVLLLNTSSGMSSSYENVSDYITGAFLSEFLRIGDTFHLIPYSGSAKLDVARRISQVGDVETIIGRMLLQYPIESGDNPGAAITFTEQYITSLPTRPKKIVLVSTESTGMENLVNTARQRLSSLNTTIDYIQVTPGQPLVNLPSSGRGGTQRSTTTTGTVAQTTTQTQGTTATAGTTAVQDTSTVQVTQTTDTTITGTSDTTVTGTTADTVDLIESTVVSDTIVSDTSVSDTSVSDTTRTTESTDTTGTQQTPVPERLTDTRSIGTFSLSIPAIIGIILLLLLILGLIIFLATRRLGSSPNRVMASVAVSRDKDEPRNEQRFADHSKDLAEYAAIQARQRTTPYTDRHEKIEVNKPAVINHSGPLLLNLFVEDQSIAIGKRNIHSLKSGYNLTVGGGKSDFLIFLVSIPPNIGELRRSGSQLTFIPRKPKYFPDLGSSELRDCLNKTIRVISDKGYELRLKFEMYEDPLVSLNRMLMSIKVPG
jgi:hypothetical protein